MDRAGKGASAFRWQWWARFALLTLRTCYPSVSSPVGVGTFSGRKVMPALRATDYSSVAKSLAR